MKRILYIFIFFLLPGASLNVIAQDYYSGNSCIKGENLQYHVLHKDYDYFEVIRLDNVANVLSNRDAYDTVAKQYYSESMHPMPQARPDYDSRDAIVSSIFSESDISRFFSKDCYLKITFRIDPHSRRAIELKFSLYYTSSDKRILSLPVTKIEQLETALKKDLLFYVPEKGKDADFLIVSGRIL